MSICYNKPLTIETGNTVSNMAPWKLVEGFLHLDLGIYLNWHGVFSFSGHFNLPFEPGLVLWRSSSILIFLWLFLVSFHESSATWIVVLRLLLVSEVSGCWLQQILHLLYYWSNVKLHTLQHMSTVSWSATASGYRCHAGGFHWSSVKMFGNGD